MPTPARTGRGRRHINQLDHLASPMEHDEAWTTRPTGRKHIQCEDHLEPDKLFTVSSQVPAGSHEVKEALRDLLVNQHSLLVFDEARWAKAGLDRLASTWRIRTENEQLKTLGREGRTPKALAEVMSLLPVAELRHFGLRFGAAANGKTVATANGTLHPPSPRGLALNGDDNPTYVSPGVHGALGMDAGRVQNYMDMSYARREPEEMSRRFIRSGKDHWDSWEVASHGTAGDAKDVSYAEGIERCIGHGRRHIPMPSHMSGGGAVLN